MLAPEAENLAANVVAGKATGTNAPFVNITATTVDGSAGLDVGDSTLVESSDGNATITLTIKSPLWAEFDKVQFLVNASTEAVDDDMDPMTPPRYRALPGDACTVPNGCYEVNSGDVNFVMSTINDFPLIPGAQHREATVTLNLTGLTQDTWVIALVRGTDGVSKPLFPFDPSNIQRQACSNNPCRACTTNTDCTVPGTCTVTNQTLLELTDGNLNQCGVPTLAFTNPLYINANGVTGWQAPGVMLAP
jgi:hypothetical protein